MLNRIAITYAELCHSPAVIDSLESLDPPFADTNVIRLAICHRLLPSLRLASFRSGSPSTQAKAATGATFITALVTNVGQFSLLSLFIHTCSCFVRWLVLVPSLFVFFFWNTEHDYEYVVVFAVEITIFTVLRPRFKVIYSPRTFIPVIGYVPRLSDSCDTKTAKLICILYLSAAFSLFFLEFFRYLPTTPMATWGSCNAGNVPKSCRTIS